TMTHSLSLHDALPISNYEGQSSYSFEVTATDTATNVSSAQAVTLAILNKDEVAPVVTSSATATSIAENSGAGQVVYTVTATDLGADEHTSELQSRRES